MRRLAAEKIYCIQLPEKTDSTDRALTLRCNGEDVRFPMQIEDPFVKKKSGRGLLLTLGDTFHGDRIANGDRVKMQKTQKKICSRCGA